MRILYSALRHDPTNPDLASGVDYCFYSSFIREGAVVQVVGPFDNGGWLWERAVNKFYKQILKKRYLKWNLQVTRISARALNKAERLWEPDLVFGLFPPPLAFYSGRAPAVFNTDTTICAWQQGGANFGALPLRILTWEERRTVRNCALTITFSESCKRDIVSRHGIESHRVHVQPMPSALPITSVPPREEMLGKTLASTVNLLLVGRDYVRKGIAVGLETVSILKARGVSCRLTVCGVQGVNTQDVKFVGPFRKSVASELAQYVTLYRDAHILIHPAVYEAAGIVPAEAAGFGVPTITNDVGGLSTSIAHEVSGIVLPAHSPAAGYAEVIERLVKSPKYYAKLCSGARDRYDRDQNWLTVGKSIMRLLESVVENNSNRR